MNPRISLKSLRSVSTNYCEKSLIYFKQIALNFPLKLFLLDEISKTLCEFSDKLSITSVFLRNSANFLETSTDIERSSQEIQRFLHELNKNSMIYNHLLYMKHHETAQFLTDHERQFLHKMIEDYEIKYGIIAANSSSKTPSISELLSKEEVLKAEFEGNIYTNKEILRIDERFVNEIASKPRVSPGKVQENGGFLALSCNYKEILLLAFRAKSLTLKKSLFSAYFNANRKNLEPLVSLLKTRSFYAFLVNPAETFAELALRTGSMVKNAVNPSQLQEILINESFSLNRQIETLVKSGVSKQKPNLVELFTSVFAEKRENSLISTGFPLENSMNCLKSFYETFTSLKLGWKLANFKGFSGEIASVCFEIREEKSGDSLGEIEIFLFEFDCTQTMISQGNCKFSLSGKYKTKPKLLLLFDFFKSAKTAEISRFSLSFTQMRKIVHEFSHALHNILSFHEFQYVCSNTRLDYAEFVAILFENLFAKYVENAGKPANPEVLLGDLVTQLEQIYFSLIDLRFHSEQQLFSRSSGEIAGKLREINAEIFNLVFGNYEFCKEMADNCYFCSMLHLTTYAAAYYSYALGDILAKALTNREFSQGNLQKKLTKILSLAHKDDVFYLILKEIFFIH